MQYKRISAGDTAATFTQRSPSNENYSFDTAGGRYILLGFIGMAGDSIGKGMMDFVLKNRKLFDDDKLAFFGITMDEGDIRENRLPTLFPGIRQFIDSDGKISKLYGSAPTQAKANESIAFLRQWILLDPMMRVHSVFKVEGDKLDTKKLLATLKGLPSIDEQVGFKIQAPILVLPRVLEPELCERLINLYKTNGGVASGYMKQVNGKTIGVNDLSHKSRTDYIIEDDDLMKLLQHRVQNKIVPQIAKVHQYNVTRMERYIVGCYDVKTGGHFRAHRDNTTSGTAHRRFAVSINLNDGFDGGEVGFAEYGSTTYKPPIGGAVVFSCSLLHHVTKITRGTRYAFLPFLYDDAAAKIREQNNRFLDEQVSKYQPVS